MQQRDSHWQSNLPEDMQEHLPFTSMEIRFLSFRDVYFEGLKAALGVRREEDVWDLFPDVGFHLSTAWYKATGMEGIYSSL